MMTAEERVAALHARMDAMQRARERRKTQYYGAGSAALFVCLLVMIFGGSVAHPGGMAALYSGATMLYENAGAYVLAAVLAFMAGVLLTVFLLRSRRKSEKIEKEAAVMGNKDKK